MNMYPGDTGIRLGVKNLPALVALRRNLTLNRPSTFIENAKDYLTYWWYQLSTPKATGMFSQALIRNSLHKPLSLWSIVPFKSGCYVP